MIKSAVTARDSVNPVSLRINFSVVTANLPPPHPTHPTLSPVLRSHSMPDSVCWWWEWGVRDMLSYA